MTEYVNPEYTPEPEKVNVKKGLEGAVIDVSEVSKVNAETSTLIYRGYNVADLAEQCSFEEVAHLLLEGELPNQNELQKFSQEERSLRAVSKEVLALAKLLPTGAHPMDTLRTLTSFLGCEDGRIWQNDKATNKNKAMSLLAKIPTLVALDLRRRKGQEFIAPRADLNLSENFFYMCFGELPDKRIVKAFDASLVLYAEHSFNASTFASRVVTSTQSDLYSAVVAGIGALKGPLHGGANEAVMHMMLEIGDPQKARAWMLSALEQKKKVMGFGHRVYKKGDSRVPSMKKYMMDVCAVKNAQQWLTMYEELERVMIEKKNIYPNLDFPAGPTYYMMGFDIEFFTPIFVMSRITGWSAHIMEQTLNNRIIRPLAEYRGASTRSLVPLSARG